MTPDTTSDDPRLIVVAGQNPFVYWGDASDEAPATHEPSRNLRSVSALRVGIGIAIATALFYVLLTAALVLL